MSELAPKITIDHQEITRQVVRRPLSFIPLALEMQTAVVTLDPENFVQEKDYREFWATGERLRSVAEQMKQHDMHSWQAIYGAEQLASDALAALKGVATTSRTCGISLLAQQALLQDKDFPDRIGKSPDEAVAAVYRLDVVARAMVGGSSRQISALGLALCQGNPIAQRMLQRRYDSADSLAHMTAPRILESMKSSGMLSSIPEEKRGAALDVIQGYTFWNRLHNQYEPFAGEITLPARPTVRVEAPAPVNADAQIERLSQQSTSLRARHAELMQPFHIPSKLEKKQYRPFIRAVLHDVRLDNSSLVTPDGIDGAVFSKRLAATVFGIQKLAKPHQDDPEKLRELLLSERTVYQRLIETDSQLEELIVETPQHVLSLDMMLEWIRDNWPTLSQTLANHWPDKPNKAVRSTQAVLSCKKELDDELNADPRKRLYALAKQLGRIALPREERDSKSDAVRNYRVDPETASSGLDELIHLTKDRLVRERARVVDYFLSQASELAQQTGDQSYGLYFAEVASDTRDRYFIVKCRDDQNRDWYVLETLEGERATYVVPSEVAIQVLGPFETSEQEIEAIIRNNKTDARALGDAGNYRAQIYHQKHWTSSSHIQKVLQRMNGWQP